MSHFKKYKVKIIEENNFGKGRYSLLIQAFLNENNEKIAEATFAWNKELNEIKVGNVLVSAEHRRKGIATAMYQLAEEYSGLVLLPSHDQSDDAKKFWDNYSKIRS